MDLSELPPFEDLIKDYDIEFCKSMISYIEIDINNLKNKSMKMNEIAASIRGLTVDCYTEEKKSVLNDNIRLLNERIEELSQ